MIRIQKNISLAPYVTFKIGGPAKFFAEVSNKKDLKEALIFAEKNNLRVFILGGGSNILISDKGFEGLVIKLLDSSFLIHASFIECGAGLALSEAVKLAADNLLSGLEWATGIPGTVGGAIRGNAGAYGSSMEKLVAKVEICEISDHASEISNKVQSSKLEIQNFPPKANQPMAEKFKTFLNSECEFSYRNSVFKKNPNLIIMAVVLKLEKGSGTEIKNKIKEIIKKRSKKHPKEQSAGSFFQNPEVNNQKLIERFEKDSRTKCENNRIPAGWLISEAGLKNRKIGGAKVSLKHANFIINTGKATAEDVIMLVSIIKQKVRKDFGVQLKEEIQYVGF